MNTTQWIVTMHYGTGHSEVTKFDTKAGALNCIRTTVFENEDLINFSCYRKTSTLEDKFEDLKKLIQMINS
jgi:hypothetical protein